MAALPVKSEKTQLPQANLSPTVYQHRRKNRQSQRTTLMKKRKKLAEKHRELSIAFASSEEVVTGEIGWNRWKKGFKPDIILA